MNKTISELILSAKSGSQDAFAALKEQYRPLIDRCVYKFASSDMTDQEVEDLSQEALICFCCAVCSYDCGIENVEFGLYAKICIANALVSQLRVIHRRKLEIVDAELCEGDGGEGDPARRLMEREAAEALVARIQSLLSPYENRVWSLFIAGLSVRDIARAVGKTPHSVENAVYRIRQKLRQALGGQG